jgi:cytochrome b pre-mRNA-processing protein 6
MVLQYKIVGSLMEPRSNPTHYADLIKELQEAPNRTFFGRIAKKLGGLIRFS